MEQPSQNRFNHSIQTPRRVDRSHIVSGTGEVGHTSNMGAVVRYERAKAPDRSTLLSSNNAATYVLPLRTITLQSSTSNTPAVTLTNYSNERPSLRRSNPVKFPRPLIRHHVDTSSSNARKRYKMLKAEKDEEDVQEDVRLRRSVMVVSLDEYHKALRLEYEGATGRQWTPLTKTDDGNWDWEWDNKLVAVDENEVEEMGL